MHWKRQIRDFLLMCLIPCAAFFLVVFMQHYFDIAVIAPMMFLLSVFLVSMLTDGYVWGIGASLIGVLAVNFAFTFPYLEFNISLPQNLFSGVVMLTVSLIASTMMSNLRKQQLLQMESEKETMRANLLRAVSHDLRTPLTAIYGCCSTIADNYDSLERAQKLKLLREVCEDAQWLTCMVENLLSITRIDSETVSVEKVPTVLEELIDTVLMRFRKHFPEQEVITQIPDAFIVIPMDSLLIEQVLINLLENAVYHAKGMTRLQLRVFTLGRQVIFEVEDNGCGIPKEQLAALYTGEFVKTAGSVDGKRRSMGIGLPVCATIVRAHGGEVQVESKEGRGSIFRFSLIMEEETHGEQPVQDFSD